MSLFYLFLLIAVIATTMVTADNIPSIDTAAFNWPIANTSVWLSAASYCDTSDYLTRQYKGPSSGFVPVVAIDESKYDTQGYVGYMPSQQKIYVVFRGSTSIEDWLQDLSVLLCSAENYCAGCEIHCGFQETEQKAFPLVVDAVNKLHAMFPTYGIVVTGHSLGAAIGTLVTLDLLALKFGVPIGLQIFGSPRVGNDKFVEFASSIIADRSRNTHYKDIVPHCPMHERFTHISGEVYEPNEVFDGTVKACNGYEDPTCSYQWHVTSIDDHMHYLGLFLDCKQV